MRLLLNHSNLNQLETLALGIKAVFKESVEHAKKLRELPHGNEFYEEWGNNVAGIFYGGEALQMGANNIRDSKRLHLPSAQIGGNEAGIFKALGVIKQSGKISDKSIAKIENFIANHQNQFDEAQRNEIAQHIAALRKAALEIEKLAEKAQRLYDKIVPGQSSGKGR